MGFPLRVPSFNFFLDKILYINYNRIMKILGLPLAFEVKLFWANDLQSGYKLKGTINFPFTQKFGYLHLYVHAFFLTVQLAWEIV